MADALSVVVALAAFAGVLVLGVVGAHGLNQRLRAENRRLREVEHYAEQFLLTWDAAARGESVSNDEMLGRSGGLRRALAASKQEGPDDV